MGGSREGIGKGVAEAEKERVTREGERRERDEGKEGRRGGQSLPLHQLPY